MKIARKGRTLSSCKRYYSNIDDRDVVVCGFARTPIGKISGSLSSLTAPKLGAHAIQHAVERSGIDKKYIEEAFMGNVVSAGIGQAPARQSIIYSGFQLDVACTTVNKVCASGMKALMLASLSISSNYRSACIAGGMESMSNIPYYLPGARGGYRLGNNTVVDGVINDGLWDIYNNQHMGNCGEVCATKYAISREEQDDFAIESYRRATDAWNTGKFDAEVAPITIASSRGAGATTVTKDEEYSNIKLDKVRALKAAFKKDGLFLIHIIFIHLFRISNQFLKLLIERKNFLQAMSFSKLIYLFFIYYIIFTFTYGNIFEIITSILIA
jgi:acetyl-CoA C-acetyltransferase